MKYFLAGSILSSILILTACSGNTDEKVSNETVNPQVENSDDNMEKSTSSQSNLFNKNDIEEGYWIGQSGQEISNEDMLTSNIIDYSSSFDYLINKTAYISYYSGDELLDTILHSGELPITVIKNEQADGIKISIDTTKIDEFSLTIK